MNRQDFYQLLVALPQLNLQQRGHLQEALAHPGKRSPLLDELEVRFSKQPSCPKCKQKKVHRWGMVRDVQRYRCCHCHKTFTALTNTPLAYLHHPDRWLTYVESMLDSKILRLAGADCGIALSTSFRWRHRFLKLAERLNADHFSGIVEADQTLIRESFKGRKKGLPRLARKRGNDHKKEAHWVPVLVARDRERHEADFVLDLFTLVNVEASLMPRIPKDIVLCSDGHLTFEALAAKYHLEHKVLNATDGVRVKEGAYHIQNVNNYHRRLKHWLAPFQGVATKYLHRYLGWFRWFDQHPHSLRQPIDFALDFVAPG